jgi:soluble lytic murein transglycosylase
LLLISVVGATSTSATAAPAVTVDDLLSAADRLRIGGNYPAALVMYQKAIDASSADPSELDISALRTSVYRLAQTFGLDNNSARASETWQRFLKDFPDDPRRPFALLQHAAAARQLKDFAVALADYQVYRSLTAPDDPLAPYIALELAQGYRDAGQFNLAVKEFQTVLTAPDLTPGMRTLTAQQLGDTLYKSGDNEAAVRAYDDALQTAQTAVTRSQLEVAAAKSLVELGRTDEALVRYRRVLSDDTEGDAAPQAVEQLVKLAPKDFNFYQAGLAYYYRHQYAAAVDWFHRYLNEQSDFDLAHYYAAKAYEYNGQQDRAIREWTVLVDTHQSSTKVAEAMFERADDYHRLNVDATAIRLYQQLAALLPGTHWAEDSLVAVATIYDDAEKYTDAAKQYEALQGTYPRGARAAEALSAAGLSRFHAGDLKSARLDLEKLAAYPSSTWKAKGLFWLGKILQKQGLGDEAKVRWMQAFQAKPDDYYGMRAQDLALGTVPLGNERSNYSAPSAFPGSQRTMERWLLQWAANASTDDPSSLRHPGRLSTIRADLAADPRLLRGRLLLEIGMQAEGRAELRSLANQYKDDVVAQYQLTEVWRELGLYDMLIVSGYRIMSPSPEDNLNLSPDYLQRMVYPDPFGELIISEAQKNGVDPLLYYGLLWQESQFDPASSSSVGARGLGQVMPGTGMDIANALKRTGFNPDDLFKPYVSVEFGAYYFGHQYQSFDRDYMMALAGYNAGPGNAMNWKNVDVDVAVENIRFAETRTYVRRVYQHYWYYRHLYGG